MLFLPLFLAGLSIITWQLIGYGQQKTLEFQAIEIAGIISRQAASARSVFAKHVVGKLRKDGFGAHLKSENKKGFVPLPAQFLKLFGQQASKESDGLFSYKPISKWNLEPSQGLDDDFKRWAWGELEKQDMSSPVGPIDWKPVWRLEDVNGISTLRYLRADPASAASCVHCHNAYESTPEVIARRQQSGVITGRQWKQHQLLGAIQVDIPLQKIEMIAAEQANFTTVVIVVIMGLGFVVIAFLIIRDSLRTEQINSDFIWRANHDELTGLASRLAFENRAGQLIDRSRRDNSAHALMILDLDQFKIINDTCGHDVGDKLISELATMLKGFVREGDTLARLGGDEFGLILNDCDIDDAFHHAEALRMKIQDKRFTEGNREFQLGASIGLVPITAASEGVASVLSLADLACHTAKENGRNRIQVFDDQEETQINKRQSEMDWASKFRNTIENNQLRLAVQYSRRLNDVSRPEHYSEILLRIVDEAGNFVSPVDFISAAERYQFMPTVDRWIVKTVFELIRDKQLPLRADEIIAINLSGLSINDPDFFGYIEELFSVFDTVPAGRICFEITETATIGNLSNAQHFIQSLHDFGCLFSLDDFGSGLSSFAYLKNLPIDFLKIEGGFVLGMLDDPLDYVVVESVSLIGQRINTPVIAECVENEGILEAIQSLGIDYAQGYGIHKPTIIELPSQSSQINIKVS